MSRYFVVTDSSARFVNPHAIPQTTVTVVPNRLNIRGKLYREGVDINDEEAMKLIAIQSEPPLIVPPSVSEYLEIYKNLARGADGIISLHTSRLLSKSWDNARAAAQQMAGHCKVAVVDSRTICAAQGMLVSVAVKTIRQSNDFEEIVNTVRGAVERVYSVYYVDSMEFLHKNEIMSASHTILGTMLGIKPFLTIEDGLLKAIEKVRTRAQAIDKLVEFLIEFTHLEEAAILQHKSHITEQTRMLQDRLTIEFPGRHFPYMLYSPTLACLIGADATGVAVLEEEIELEDF